MSKLVLWVELDGKSRQDGPHLLDGLIPLPRVGDLYRVRLDNQDAYVDAVVEAIRWECFYDMSVTIVCRRKAE